MWRHNPQNRPRFHPDGQPGRAASAAGGQGSPRLRYPLLVYLLLAALWFLLLPPWQGPDEPGHLEYAHLFATLRRPPHPQDVDDRLEARILRSMDAYSFWRWTRQPRPSVLPHRFRDVPLLRRSGSQINNEAPLYYTIPALFFVLLPDDLILQLRTGRLYSLLLGALVIVVGGRALMRRFVHRPHLAEAGVWTLALLPMPVFIHVTFNANAMKDVLGALFFATAWRVLNIRGGTSPHAWGAFLVSAGLASLGGLGSLVVPLTCGTLLLLPSSPLYPWRRPLLITIGAFLLALVLYPHIPHRAYGWEKGPERAFAVRLPWRGVNHSAALYVKDNSPSTRAYVAQNLLAARVPLVWSRPMLIEGWVRAIHSPTWVCLSVADDTSQTATCTQADTSWKRIVVHHRPRRGTPYLRVVIGVGAPRHRQATGTILVDKVTARLVTSPSSPNLLINGDMEIPANRWHILLAPLLRRLHLVPSYVYIPPEWQHPLAQRLMLALAVLFTSFWGNYGWLVYPLPIPVYVILALITLLALAGWVITHLQPRTWPPVDVFDFVAVVFTLGGLLLSTVGADWMPQGRYLFPLLLPLLAMGINGLEAWRPRGLPPFRWWRAWIGLAFLFHIYSLAWNWFIFG